MWPQIKDSKDLNTHFDEWLIISDMVLKGLPVLYSYTYIHHYHNAIKNNKIRNL